MNFRKHVELGESELNQFMKDSQLLNFKYTFDPMRDYFPENIIEHPQYSENPLLYDFGLIKLNKTVTFTGNFIKKYILFYN